MKLCEKGENRNLCYPLTSEAFSIGMTMLSVGLLEGLEEVCDMRSFRFN